VPACVSSSNPKSIDGVALVLVCVSSSNPKSADEGAKDISTLACIGDSGESQSVPLYGGDSLCWTGGGDGDDRICTGEGVNPVVLLVSTAWFIGEIDL
jgi:hypothetical protein